MTKEELTRIPIMQRYLNRKAERLEQLQERATCVPAIDTSREKIQTSKVNKSMAIVDMAVDLEAELRQDSDELRAEHMKAAQFIDGLELSSNERQILNLRYVSGLYWQDISELMNYNARYVQEIHADVLKKVFG